MVAANCFSFFAELAEIGSGLDFEAKLCALFKEFAEFKRHLGGAALSSGHDFIETPQNDSDSVGQGVLENAHGPEAVLEENFARSYRRFYFGSFINRVRNFLV